MYRVLFAEDELLVRLGLQNSIPWKDFDMELVGEAENGLIAYRKFMELRPDMVITDIKMEGMDGYELIRKIREVDSQCAIVIISCLDDFEALRKMMGYCIIGYILKASMTMDEIFSVMKQAKEYLDHIYENRQEHREEKQSVSQKIMAYLQGNLSENAIQWKESTGLSPEEITSVSVLRLRDADQGKINELAMKLIQKLLKQRLPQCYYLDSVNYEITVLERGDSKELEEGYALFYKAVEQFLGVHFDRITSGHQGRSLQITYQELKEKLIREKSGGTMDEIIRKSIAYIQDNYQKPLTLSEIAGELGLSPNYFSTLFKKETGLNYSDYLSNIRLQNILEDLRTSNDKIQSVAERNGFSNLEYFSRFFKKRMGISPAKWRRKNGSYEVNN